MSRRIPLPVQDGEDITDEELARELYRSERDRIEDALKLLCAVMSWRWTDVHDEFSGNDASFADYDRYRGRPPHFRSLDRGHERAMQWLAVQDEETRLLVEQYDHLDDRLREILYLEAEEERYWKKRDEDEEESARLGLEARWRGQVRWSDMAEAAQEGNWLWDARRVITTDDVPQRSHDGLLRRGHGVVAVVLDQEDEVQIVTHTGLTLGDLSVMTSFGLQSADEGAVARALCTSRLRAARLMSWLGRPMYIYDHAHWAGDPDATRRRSPRRARKVTVTDEIVAAIGEREWTVSEIAAATGKSEAAVLLALKRGPFAKSDDRPARWHLVIEEPQAP